MALIVREGFRFRFDPSACRPCGGRCCNGESGRVRIDPNDVWAMANMTDMTEEMFAARYLYRQGSDLYVREIRTGDNFACALYDQATRGCSVYAARPRQCREFPFWERFRANPAELFQECPGVVSDRLP